MNIVVLGAGAWGTALAASAAGAAGHRVTLWARDAALSSAANLARCNARYLPDIRLPDQLHVVGGLPALDAVLQQQDLIVVATPMAALRSMLGLLARQTVPVAWLCKGFEAPQLAALDVAADSRVNAAGQARIDTSFGLLGHEIRAQAAPDLIAGVLSGPSFAQEVAKRQPTALVAASEHAGVRDALVAAFHSNALRVYASNDIVGVEVGGAVKNVLAIATGLCDGLGLGLNARAALITRGLSEMTRLGVALGAQSETFTGLSGLGDLVLTATGDLSRNRSVGLALAQGQTLQSAITSLGHVAEGVYSARTVVQRAAHLGVDMPISTAVVSLLDGKSTALEAVSALMGREPTGEGLLR